MARTHFSGPVVTGTVREGSASNFGYAVLTQSVNVVFGDSAKTLGIIPSSSRILDVLVDVREVWDSTTATMGVGVVGGSTRFLGSGSTIDLNTAGRSATGPNAAQASAMINIGSDTTIVAYVGNSSTPTTGAATVTLVYCQR